jgi:hypothetical protein
MAKRFSFRMARLILGPFLFATMPAADQEGDTPSRARSRTRAVLPSLRSLGTIEWDFSLLAVQLALTP